MASIKSYTDIEQSKKLAKILPLETADMMYQKYETVIGYDYGYSYRIQPFFSSDTEGIPCWSLAALLNILNTIDGWYPGIDAQVGEENYWQVVMFSYNTGSDTDKGASKKELIDTCYDLILKLHKSNML